MTAQEIQNVRTRHEWAEIINADWRKLIEGVIQTGRTDMNIEITADELGSVRSLTDFDLKMFLSEIHDHGWPMARNILPLIVASSVKERKGKK